MNGHNICRMTGTNGAGKPSLPEPCCEATKHQDNALLRYCRRCASIRSPAGEWKIKLARD